ncbi:MAG TPA: HNH endonuclease signature motif containing protein [Salinisphaeraceae bacterium]|nr:HNH endonuclease signature motif containing protein [Salinisphaeraceae bacterium]
MKMLPNNNLKQLKTKRRPLLSAANNHRRRLKTTQRNQQRMRVWRQDPRCYMCGIVLPYEKFELDHVVPLHLGGSTDDTNVGVACLECHREKTNRELRARAGR